MRQKQIKVSSGKDALACKFFRDTVTIVVQNMSNILPGTFDESQDLATWLREFATQTAGEKTTK